MLAVAGADRGRVAQEAPHPPLLSSLYTGMSVHLREVQGVEDVAGGFVMTVVRNETQRHSVALKNAGQNPIGLLPLSD